jgi:superfamily II DNA or RNA helicase
VYRELKSRMAMETEDGRKIDINPAALLHSLRLFTACPEKVNAVKELIEDIPGEEPIIIFTWYRDAAELVADEFQLLPSSVKITGEFNQAERLRRASALDSRVKAVTMASASEGVDWSDASTVIFFEEDYTPGKIYQAMSRVRRWSKTEKKVPIVVYYVLMRGSVDEAVHDAVVERNGDVRKILRKALR